MSPTVTGWLSLVTAILFAVIALLCADGAKKPTIALLAQYGWWAAILAWLLHVDHVGRFPW